MRGWWQRVSLCLRRVCFPAAHAEFRVPCEVAQRAAMNDEMNDTYHSRGEVSWPLHHAERNLKLSDRKPIFGCAHNCTHGNEAVTLSPPRLRTPTAHGLGASPSLKLESL